MKTVVLGNILALGGGQTRPPSGAAPSIRTVSPEMKLARDQQKTDHTETSTLLLPIRFRGNESRSFRIIGFMLAS